MFGALLLQESERHAGVEQTRRNSLQSAGRAPSKTPSWTAANMVFDRRKASIRQVRCWRRWSYPVGAKLLATIAQRAGFSFRDAADPDSRDAAFLRRCLKTSS